MNTSEVLRSSDSNIKNILTTIWIKSPLCCLLNKRILQQMKRSCQTSTHIEFKIHIENIFLSIRLVVRCGSSQVRVLDGFRGALFHFSCRDGRDGSFKESTLFHSLIEVKCALIFCSTNFSSNIL